MRTPDSKGQYRRVRYTDDGCDIYQCLWCLGTIEIRDDPHYGWNFCPKCGKSWFQRLDCRDHEVPRWYYDRWGNRGSNELVRLPGNEIAACSLPFHGKRPESTSTWVIEWRSKWEGGDWSEWQHETSWPKDPCNPDWQRARMMIVDRRGRHDSDDCIIFEYRIGLLRKNNLTFSCHGVDSNIVRDLFNKGSKS